MALSPKEGAETARATGRRYPIDLDALDVQSLRELVRLIRDLDHEKQAAVNQARMMPWRRWRLDPGRLRPGAHV